jgi:hypothetical protein
MVERRQFTLQVPRSGRQGSDLGWETVEPEYIRAWKSGVDCFRDRTILARGEKYTISIDLTGILRYHRRFWATMKYLHRDKGNLFADRIMKARFPRRPSYNTIAVSTKSREPHCLSVAESAAYDIFVIMNIAAPGCCDFYRASLTGETIEPNVSLTNLQFESALRVWQTDGWPIIQYLNVLDVLKWYESVRPIASQLPDNPMERVIFALFHMSKNDVSPVEVMWLFYAFESLLQTKAGENFSSIVRRLCLLLDVNETQSSLVRKKMRELYDIRSAIVHGGFEVTHPMNDEQIDKRVAGSFIRTTSATDYGHAFLVAAIQKTVLKGWKFPKFDERLDGEPILSDQ